MTEKAQFWRGKALDELTDAEWERLCDGCGKCCLHKLEDEDTGEIFFTRVACRLLDLKSCRCGDYANRTRRVSDCHDLRLRNYSPRWLPSTCAYRLVAEGQELPSWHPLVSGNKQSVHRAGVSIVSYAVSEDWVDCVEDHVIEWLR
jgi:uncharacterized cysteine cluster protein YcgN (CxxCxxCC family)